MALFGKGREQGEEDGLEQVLAHLEDLQRCRTQVTLLDGRAREFGGVVAGVDEEARTCLVQLQGKPAGLAKGDPAALVFVTEGVRIRAQSRIEQLGATAVTLALPKGLELHERRKAIRARLNAKEGASISALSGLFEGIGLVGPVENITGEGARLRIEKAMEIKGERKLPVGEAIVRPGHAFMLVKINHVPKCPPVMETEGRVAYVEARNGVVCLGITFGRSYPAAARFAEERAGAVPTRVPSKARRRPREEAEAPEPAVAAAQAPARVPDPAPPADRAEPTVPRPSPPAVREPDPPPGPAIPSVRPPATPVLRLKKRSRPVVVFAEAEQGHRLAELLAGDGYGRVLLAANFGEAQAALLQPNVGFLLVDMGTSLLDCLQFLGELRAGQLPLPPILLAADEVSRSLALAAKRVGAAQVLVKPYALDDHLLGILEGLLEG